MRKPLEVEIAPGIFIDPTKRLECVVLNLARLRRKRERLPFWSQVSDVTGFGSTYSAHLCRWAGVDPETGKPTTDADDSGDTTGGEETQ